MEKDNILFELIKNIKDEKFIKIVFSNKQGGDFNKIIIKSLSLKYEKIFKLKVLKKIKHFIKILN